MNEYSTRMELRIDWSEIDSIGHVNNLAIMKYVQTARVNYLEGIGMMPLQTETGMSPVMASTSCQFKKQLHYPGKVVVCSMVDHIKNTSFQMRHRVFNEAQEIIAEAHDVLVMFDFNTNLKHPVPAVFRERIEAMEHLQDRNLLPADTP